MKTIAVLGAGIMGCATALQLARRHRVVMFDRAPAPFSGASRWNEGKIHRGFLYTADPSLATARRLIPGAVSFRPLVEELLGQSIAGAISQGDEWQLVHRDSVTSGDHMASYLHAVEGLCREQPGAYLGMAADAPVRRLTPPELDAICDTRVITAGFVVPERAVLTGWIADRFIEAITAEPRIQLRLNTIVTGVEPDDAAASRLRVTGLDGLDELFDVVVNALWQQRPAIDLLMGIEPPVRISHRYRVSAFVRTAREVDVPSTLISTGPFGDVKNYNGRDFYLSWYPVGLRAESHTVQAPPTPDLTAAERDDIVGGIWRELGGIITRCQEISAAVEHCRIEGGWVYAAGDGSLADPAATLHRRHNIGVTPSGSYISVDTGKYSMAPLLAQEIAAMVE